MCRNWKTNDIEITASSYFHNQTNGANFFRPLKIRSILWSYVFHEIKGITSFNIEVICGPVNSEGIFFISTRLTVICD